MKVQVYDENGILLYEFSERTVLTPPADMSRPVADLLFRAILFFVGPTPKDVAISEASQQNDPVEVTAIHAEDAAGPAPSISRRSKVVPFKPKGKP